MGRCLSSRFHFWDELCSLPVGRSSFQARKLCIHECSLSVGRSSSQVRKLCIHECMVECNHAHRCTHMFIDFLFSKHDVYLLLNCTPVTKAHIRLRCIPCRPAHRSVLTVRWRKGFRLETKERYKKRHLHTNADTHIFQQTGQAGGGQR